MAANDASKISFTAGGEKFRMRAHVYGTRKKVPLRAVLAYDVIQGRTELTQRLGLRVGKYNALIVLSYLDSEDELSRVHEARMSSVMFELQFEKMQQDDDEGPPPLDTVEVASIISEEDNQFMRELGIITDVDNNVDRQYPRSISVDEERPQIVEILDEMSSLYDFIKKKGEPNGVLTQLMHAAWNALSKSQKAPFREYRSLTTRQRDHLLQVVVTKQAVVQGVLEKGREDHVYVQKGVIRDENPGELPFQTTTLIAQEVELPPSHLTRSVNEDGFDDFCLQYMINAYDNPDINIGEQHVHEAECLPDPLTPPFISACN